MVRPSWRKHLLHLTTDRRHLSKPPHAHPVQPTQPQWSHAAALCCSHSTQPLTRNQNCVCISQQRPARKCMHYVFEHGRVQKQLPSLALCVLNPVVSKEVGVSRRLELDLDREFLGRLSFSNNVWSPCHTLGNWDFRSCTFPCGKHPQDVAAFSLHCCTVASSVLQFAPNIWRH